MKATKIEPWTVGSYWGELLRVIVVDGGSEVRRRGERRMGLVRYDKHVSKYFCSMDDGTREGDYFDSFFNMFFVMEKEFSFYYINL